MPLRNECYFGLPEKDVDVASAEFTEITGIELEPRYSDALGGSYALYSADDGGTIRIIPITKYYVSDQIDFSKFAHMLEFSNLPISQDWDALITKLKANYELIDEFQWPYEEIDFEQSSMTVEEPEDLIDSPLIPDVVFGSDSTDISGIARMMAPLFPSEVEEVFDQEEGITTYTHTDEETGETMLMFPTATFEIRAKKRHAVWIAIQNSTRPDYWLNTLTAHPYSFDVVDDGKDEPPAED